MHSLKNTVVAVCLLAVSFGLYHVSLNPEPEIDPADIPSLDISDGFESMTEAPLDGVSEMETPSFPMAKSKAPAPGLAKPIPDPATVPKAGTIAASPKPFPGKRVPIESTKKNDVQKIQYPKTGAPSLSSIAKPRPQTEIAQHELVDPSRDKGLIDALKQQQAAETTVDEHQFVAQPIASHDSTFNDLATKIESVEADQGNNPMDSGSQFNNGADASSQDFGSAFARSEELMEAAEFRSALEILSRFYRNNNLSGPQRQRLLPTLDALAGKVIYSDEHHLVSHPYAVGQNESLDDIAGKWHVPVQLIHNVHQKSQNLHAGVPPGTKLKMLPGPFRAEVDLQSKVMTLFLGDLYAGRFPIRVGISGTPTPGTYRVMLKSKAGHDWRDSNGVDYPPGSPENGYGPNWMGLTGSLCIHQVADEASDGHHGCIGLNSKDAEDVFSILAENSEVTIIR